VNTEPKRTLEQRYDVYWGLWLVEGWMEGYGVAYGGEKVFLKRKKSSTEIWQ
jgi:hypothetical protein